MEELDSALVTKAKFQKDHGRDRCADGKDSGIAEVKLSREQLSMILAGKSRIQLGDIPERARSRL